MSNAQYFTREAHRRVEYISTTDGPFFKVTETIGGYLATTSGISEQAYVPVRYTTTEVDGQQATVLHPFTVARLRAVGVELEDLDI